MDIDCSKAREYLHAHFDRELDPVTAAGMEKHLHGCAACAKEYATQRALRQAVRKDAEYFAVPAGLAARIRAQTNTGRTTDRKSWFASWFPVAAAVAATAVITWTIAITLQSGSQEDQLAEQVIAGHARAVLTEHLVEVASSDQHTVKPWLSSKLDFSPPANDLTGAGFPLIGARLDYVNKRPVAALVYRHRQHVINVFVWPDDRAAAKTDFKSASRQGYNVLHWRNGGMTFWAISDVNAEDLKTFAGLYANAS